MHNSPTRQTKDKMAGNDKNQSYPSWYLAAILLVFLTLIAVFTISENSTPWSYLRNILGIVFVIGLPGYSLVRALFPIYAQTEFGEKIDSYERIALSIGASLGLVPLVSLFLNYTPFGISLAPIVLSLSALTIVFASTAVVRERQAFRKV